MGRIYCYDGDIADHEGFVEHLDTDGEWRSGWQTELDVRGVKTTGTFRAACSRAVGRGWDDQCFRGPAVKLEGWNPDDVWPAEAEEDRLMEAWEEHMRPLVALAKVAEAVDELDALVDDAKAAGVSDADLRAAGVRWC